MHFLANFDLVSDITQVIEYHWKHWLRVQNLPVGQSFERTTKSCKVGYMANSCAALTNFTTMYTYSKLGPPKMNIIKMPPYPSIILALFLFLNAYYYYPGIKFAGLAYTALRTINLTFYNRTWKSHAHMNKKLQFVVMPNHITLSKIVTYRL